MRFIQLLWILCLPTFIFSDGINDHCVHRSPWNQNTFSKKKLVISKVKLNGQEIDKAKLQEIPFYSYQNVRLDFDLDMLVSSEKSENNEISSFKLENSTSTIRFRRKK